MSRKEQGRAFGVFEAGTSETIAQNEVWGAGTGITFSSAPDVCVCRNEVHSLNIGIALILDSGGTRVTQNTVRRGGGFDLFWDGTVTINVWTKNEFRTSNPPNL